MFQILFLESYHDIYEDVDYYIKMYNKHIDYMRLNERHVTHENYATNERFKKWKKECIDKTQSVLQTIHAAKW
jgi:hypothetical protein